MANILKNRRNALIHIAFWLVYASFFFYQISMGKRAEEGKWLNLILDFSTHMVAMMLISYLNYFVFIPRFLKTRNLGRYLLEFLPVFLAYMYLVLIMKQEIIGWGGSYQKFLFSWRFGVNVFVLALFLVAFVGLLRFVENYFELEAKKKEFENAQLTSELRFLKAQINPHFLFNTLNNLYYLAVNQSPNTPEVISKLSLMMRYLLHDSNHNLVPLSKEIEYMKNYISLEKLRFNEEIPIEFETKGNMDGHRIAPLIIFTFLENAFKHGVSSSSKNSWIKIQMEVKDNIFFYHISNSKIRESEKTVTEKSGIGLQNVRRRLDLTYPEQYELEMKDTENSHVVELKIDMK